MTVIPPILRYTVAGAPRLFSRLYAIEKLLAAIPAPERVLEIGPGLGDLAAYLCERFPAATFELAELSADAAAGLRRRFRDHRRVEISEEDVLARSTIASTFDLVIACEVFEHIENDAAGFQNVARLLKRGGSFIFSAPSHMAKWQASDEFVGHYRRYERDEVIEKLTSAGFEIQRLWTFGFPSVNLVQPLRDLYYRIRSRDQFLDKQRATEKSGIDRPSIMRYAKWAVIAAMLPLLPIESRLWRKDLGDGYLALARKP